MGFAAETNQLDSYALEKLRKKRLDLIVANLIGPADTGFSSDTNRVALFFKDGTQEQLDTMQKVDLAHELLDRIAALRNKQWSGFEKGSETWTQTREEQMGTIQDDCPTSLIRNQFYFPLIFFQFPQRGPFFSVLAVL